MKNILAILSLSLVVGCCGSGSPTSGTGNKPDPRTDIYEAGRLHGLAKLPRGDNPYIESTDLWGLRRRELWQSGYNGGLAERVNEETDRKFLEERRQRVPQ